MGTCNDILRDGKIVVLQQIAFGQEVSCPFTSYRVLSDNKVMGYTSDLMPHVGLVPAKDGQFIMAGFNGHGMPLIWKTAKGISEMLNGKTFEETEVPEIFKTTKERLLSDRNDILNLAPR